MRVVFAGTPAFSVPSLQVLANAPDAEIIAIYTQPDRPTGRGKKISINPVKALGLKLSVPIIQPQTFKSVDAAANLDDLDADLMVVIAYGLKLPDSILAVPRLGCVNVHASLLPRWRGAAPIQRAIEAGDRSTGITLMQMTSGLDCGPILTQSELAIDGDETAAVLHDRLAALGGVVLSKNLPAIMDQSLQSVAQDESMVTHAAKLTKAEGKIDWMLSAKILERKIRAYNPWPVATTKIDGNLLRLLKASTRDLKDQGKPGNIHRADRAGILVQTGRGQLNIERVQRPGGRPMPVAEFLNGIRICSGMRFEFT